MIVLTKNVPKCIYPALTYKHLNYMAHGDIMYLCLSTHMKTIQLGHRLVIYLTTMFVHEAFNVDADRTGALV